MDACCLHQRSWIVPTYICMCDCLCFVLTCTSCASSRVCLAVSYMCCDSHRMLPYVYLCLRDPYVHAHTHTCRPSVASDSWSRVCSRKDVRRVQHRVSATKDVCFGTCGVVHRICVHALLYLAGVTTHAVVRVTHAAAACMLSVIVTHTHIYKCAGNDCQARLRQHNTIYSNTHTS